MHLSRGYPWNLELSERELSLIEQALQIVVAESDFDADDHRLAEKLLNNISTIHQRVILQRQNREGPQSEEDLHEHLHRTD
jgi:hypothetical protein